MSRVGETFEHPLFGPTITTDHDAGWVTLLHERRMRTVRMKEEVLDLYREGKLPGFLRTLRQASRVSRAIRAPLALGITPTPTEFPACVSFVPEA